ncbi:MAG: polyprenyl synthetase family protein [Phaeodactylibacter sp.]|nr:polyprenyl synthetase family protein [Phaeodactylibacter sp.]MCB9264540.1 polyprenyl synthetase family protein [Lewinellaceae bacterium]
MHTIEQLRATFEEYLETHPFSGEPRGLYAPMAYVMSMGGKRLRPLLALMSAQLFGAEVRVALPLAMAVEVFHNFSLIHDDIMDEAPLRRGKATVHQKYGLNAGILSGDAMLIYAYEFIRQVENQEAVPRLVREFNRVAIEVCEGQQYDMDFEERQDVSIEDYLMMIERKTAALIEGSLVMGAVAAGAPEPDIEKLAVFGRNIGLAFQLQDDILDTFGDPLKFGKKVGGDIAQNKKTFLILKALQLARGETRRKLAAYMSSTPEDEARKIEEVTGILRQLNIQEWAETVKEQKQDVAMNALERIHAPEERKAPLRNMSLKLIQRES